MTIIMVTHERPLAEQFASRIVTLGDGKLKSDTPNAAAAQQSANALRQRNPRPTRRAHENPRPHRTRLPQSPRSHPPQLPHNSRRRRRRRIPRRHALPRRRPANPRLAKNSTNPASSTPSSSLQNAACAAPSGDGDRPRRNDEKSAKSEPAKPLDETARQEFEKLPNVTEAYPQVRFLTEVRFNGNSYSTNVLGMPDSSRNTGSFDDITGKYFSSPTADEAILQSEFAKELNPQPASARRKGNHSPLRPAPRKLLRRRQEPKDIDDEMDDMLSGVAASPSFPTTRKCASSASSTPIQPSASAASAAAASSFH